MLAAIPQLRAFAVSLCRNRDHADDLVQQTLLRACDNMAKFAPGTDMRAGLITILRNQKIKTASKRATKPYYADARVVLVLDCSKCGRSGEVTISENLSPSAGQAGFVVHTISPEFKVLMGFVHWHRIMICCICDEVFCVVRRPKSAA
jgi:hypothetical protein